MRNKYVCNLLAALAILILAAIVVRGGLAVFAHRNPGDQMKLMCPARPQQVMPTPTPTPSKLSYLTVISEYTMLFEGTFIRFRATADAAEDVAGFGTVSNLYRESYKLRVDTIKYNYQEVIDYLNSWDDCYGGIPIPTATPDDSGLWHDASSPRGA